MKLVLYLLAGVVLLGGVAWAFLMPPVAEVAGEGPVTSTDSLGRRIAVAVASLALASLLALLARKKQSKSS